MHRAGCDRLKTAGGTGSDLARLILWVMTGLFIFSQSPLKAETLFRLQSVFQYTEGLELTETEGPQAVVNGVSLHITPDWRQTYSRGGRTLELLLMGQLEYLKNEGQDRDIGAYWYRYLLRYSGERADLKLGLQKINFGPAQFLRTLQWFDTLNPLDPSGRSDGVEAVLLRMYPHWRVNVWFWALAADRRDGLNYLLTEDPENPSIFLLNRETEVRQPFGGRVQIQLAAVDLGLSLHHRQPDYAGYEYREYRAALDLRGEWGIGWWLEAMQIQRGEIQDGDFDRPAYFGWDPFMFLEKSSRALTLGADYTMGIGNGIYTMLEYAKRSPSAEFDRLPPKQEQALFMLSYPLGLFDSFMALFLRDMEQEIDSRSLIWLRTYDRLTWQLMVSSLSMGASDGEYLSGRLTMVVNL